jgi:hypothetical protein
VGFKIDAEGIVKLLQGGLLKGNQAERRPVPDFNSLFSLVFFFGEIGTTSRGTMRMRIMIFWGAFFLAFFFRTGSRGLLPLVGRFSYRVANFHATTITKTTTPST